LNFDMIWTEKDDSAIGCHEISFSVVQACWCFGCPWTNPPWRDGM